MNWQVVIAIGKLTKQSLLKVANCQLCKMSKPSSSSENKDLVQELQSAIDEDKRYWLQNDAKLRAVVTSKSYDEFR